MSAQFPWLEPFKRNFVPQNLIPTTWETVEPYYKKLLEANPQSEKELLRWLQDWSELEDMTHEEGTKREVEMTCHTDDEKLSDRHLHFVNTFTPHLTRYDFLLSKKFLENPHSKNLPASYDELKKQFLVSLELFKEENIPLETELEELEQTYQQITGDWMVSFEEKSHTIPEMETYLEKNDRPLRERAWKAIMNRRLQDADKLESLFDEMLRKRNQISNNLGLQDYREYIFKATLRDYTPQDCLKFHQSTEEVILPLVRKIHGERKKKLGVSTLKPWDLDCDLEGLPPLQPFKNTQALQDGVENIFSKIDPQLKNYFHSIRPYQDLDSRKGKAPGGYQATFDERRIPFIFANAAGLQGDVETLLHEAGHSFHTLLARDQKLHWYQSAPMEFCEVASMSQELLGGPHFKEFYSTSQEGNRARRSHLRSVILLFPWVMTVDAFQHWIYTHPQHTITERENQWQSLMERFNGGVDYSDAPPQFLKKSWHKQLHIFLNPFYYIEYAISQVGALQIFRNYKKDPLKTLDQFKQAMALGGSQPLRTIFKTAGIQFCLTPDFLKELMDEVYEDIYSKSV